MKRLIFFGMVMIVILSVLTGCAAGTDYTDELDETSVESTSPEIADEDYYRRFVNDKISINVYSWGEYIPDGSEEGVMNLNAEFTKLTGIKVNYSTYATNEELYAKLKGGGASYDVIIPSDYMISRMIKEDMLEPIDFGNIPNSKYVMEKFLNPEYDPQNEYSVPYTWGTVGIIYDKTAIDPSEVKIDWDILWDEKYKDSVLMFDNPRDAFAIAEIREGISLNSEDSAELERAAELLVEQKPIVQAYVMDEIFDKMGAGEAVLAPYYAGDGVSLMDEYDHIGFVIPESGTNLFFDAACIPKGAKQKAAAEMYINFLCEPDVAYAIADYIGYSTPNQAAYEMLDDDVKYDGISYPDDEFLAEKTTVFRNLSDDANQKMQDLWTSMKSAETKTVNLWLVPMFMLACILVSVVVLIRRYIKNKKDIF